MSLLIGYKKEMMQIFSADGDVIPCTVIDINDVIVVGKRTEEKNKYKAVIFGIGRKKKPSKPEKGKYKDLKYVPRHVCEIRIDDTSEDATFEVGKEVKLDTFAVGDKVHVTGISKGKGFQGVIKRWGFKGGPKTHGQSDKHRSPGSIGGGTDPGRVYKGKKMPGRMGNDKVTILNLEVAKVDQKNGILCIKSAVPGGRNSLVKIRKRN